VRSLYQVKVEYADEADEIFATLMGDVVDPRREFVQNNALKVVNWMYISLPCYLRSFLHY
jgi:DNA gyrase subunit B